MKEHPILFKPNLAQMAHSGQKTQTRRIGTRYASWKVGDFIWVKETYWQNNEDGSFLYAARHEEFALITRLKAETGLARYNWKPSIFMPRCASRTLLRISSIGQNKLWDTTENDAIAEGVQKHGSFFIGSAHAVKGTSKSFSTAIAAFADLWDSINKTTDIRWSANPLVWRVEFNQVST